MDSESYFYRGCAINVFAVALNVFCTGPLDLLQKDRPLVLQRGNTRPVTG